MRRAALTSSAPPHASVGTSSPGLQHPACRLCHLRGLTAPAGPVVYWSLGPRPDPPSLALALIQLEGRRKPWARGHSRFGTVEDRPDRPPTAAMGTGHWERSGTVRHPGHAGRGTERWLGSAPTSVLPAAAMNYGAVGCSETAVVDPMGMRGPQPRPGGSMAGAVSTTGVGRSVRCPPPGGRCGRQFWDPQTLPPGPPWFEMTVIGDGASRRRWPLAHFYRRARADPNGATVDE